MDAKFRDFDGIYVGGRSSEQAPGRFKVSEAGLGWKNSETQQILTVPAAEVHQLQWMHVARGYAVVVTRRDLSTVRFDGFPKDAFDGLDRVLVALYSRRLAVRTVSTRGWSWGRLLFARDSLQFAVQGRVAFEVPLLEVANATSTRTEVAVELAGAAADRTDRLVEMRFHVPHC